MNINCKPRSPLNWHFELESQALSAILETSWLLEHGTLTLENRQLEIAKRGFFSGEWNLSEKGQILWLAKKVSPLKRKFVLTSGNREYILQASGLGRTMTLNGPQVNLTLAPAHPLTRRATIVGQSEDFTQAAFAFWLSILLWRRAANSAN